MKTKLNTKTIALFVAILLCFAVLLSPFAVFKADAETLEAEETQQNVTTSTVQRVSDFSFCKEVMGLNESSAKKQAEKEPVVPDYDFYRYETNNAYFYVADLIEERSGLICLAIESRSNGNILHLAFYDEEEDAFTYYYESVEESFANAIKSIAIDSEESDDPNVSAIFASTRWYKHAFPQTEAEDFSVDNTLENSKQKLEQYYAAQEQAEAQLAQSKESAALQLNAAGGSSTNEVFATATAAGHDDTITIIIPRELFTYAGKKTGNDGALGYFVDTYEYPEGSGRFVSEALVWSHFYTAPSYESDQLILITTPDFSANLEYAKNGYAPGATPVDTVRRMTNTCDLAIKNITSQITIIPNTSYYLNGTLFDNDEFIYAIEGLNAGAIYPDDSTNTGFASTIADALGLVSTALSFIDVTGAFATALGVASTALSLLDDIVGYTNGINEDFEPDNKHFTSNFIADRNRHYNINGNKFIRQIRSTTAPQIYFGPQDHLDFKETECYSELVAWLNTEGTNIYKSKKIQIINQVEIINMYFYTSWFQKKIEETYLATKSITQESLYYRGPSI